MNITIKNDLYFLMDPLTEIHIYLLWIKTL